MAAGVPLRSARWRVAARFDAIKSGERLRPSVLLNWNDSIVVHAQFSEKRKQLRSTNGRSQATTMAHSLSQAVSAA